MSDLTLLKPYDWPLDHVNKDIYQASYNLSNWFMGSLFDLQGCIRYRCTSIYWLTDSIFSEKLDLSVNSLCINFIDWTIDFYTILIRYFYRQCSSYLCFSVWLLVYSTTENMSETVDPWKKFINCQRRKYLQKNQVHFEQEYDIWCHAHCCFGCCWLDMFLRYLSFIAVSISCNLYYFLGNKHCYGNWEYKTVAFTCWKVSIRKV